mgnify:CR=1 FL=1
MTTYIYLKTHNKTGYKYLGKTISKDPHTYSGSGKLWLRHLNKHGFDYTTEILEECETKEVRERGLYYSKLYNIVEDKSFANLMVESGDGGATRGTGWHHSKETIEKMKNPKVNTTKMKLAQQKPEQRDRLSKTQKEWHSNKENYDKKMESMKRACQSEESIRKRSKTMETLKWCNDGIRSYRLSSIPPEFATGRLRL